ncbi:hypothetical protein [Kordia jejudonensis]|uniref:hypothetical protein n=1 Tax=Kordia jejudonensis TaxID=1348245 RepID=UPI00062920F5|nr:hypothetical protein [Kordia jejudonensis]
MKYLFCLFSVFLFADGCNDNASESKAQDEVSIEYEASTRGFYQKINVSKQEITVHNDRSGKGITKACNEADWTEIMALLDNIDAEKLKESYTNTDDVGRDASIPATLAIKYKEDMVKNITVPHGNPPKIVAPLLNKIQAMAKAVDKP